MSTPISDVLHSWNPAAPSSLLTTQIEDDSLRDGLQGAFVTKPSLPQKQELVALLAAVRVHEVMLGFPASSREEFADCQALLAFMASRQLDVLPAFLARAKVEDVEPIAALNDLYPPGVRADFFLGSSPLRRVVEGWDVAELMRKLQSTASHLVNRKVRFGATIEDATRTPPSDLRDLISCGLESGAEVIAICDTVGETTPAGATRLVHFVREHMDKVGRTARISWHGHNDRGLALANALAAAEAGATAISGSFLGIGERSGNTPLEQAILYLYQAGNRRYRVELLQQLCETLARLTSTPLAQNAPLIGEQAFATCTGTHSAAILKARALGIDFEDYIFSAVPASVLGRGQDVLIGPTSGLANARHALVRMGVPVTDELAQRLLEFAKTRDSWLPRGELDAWVKTHASG